jgi:hypothetical protein
MAMIDQKNLLSEDKAFPSSATTEYSDYELHFETGLDAFGDTVANPNIGHGSPIYFNFVVTATGATSAQAATLSMELVAATTTAPVVTTNFFQYICAAIPRATLVAGYKFCVALQEFPACPVYLRLAVTTNTYGMSTGTYSAWLSDCPLSDV